MYKLRLISIKLIRFLDVYILHKYPQLRMPLRHKWGMLKDLIPSLLGVTMSFQDQNGNYYGYDLGDGNSYQPIPDNWDFEITNLPSPGSELSSDGKTFKYCTGSENPNNTFTIRIKVFDKNTGTEISNLGNVNLTLYIRDKFKIGNGNLECLCE